MPLIAGSPGQPRRGRRCRRRVRRFSFFERSVAAVRRPGRTPCSMRWCRCSGQGFFDRAAERSRTADADAAAQAAAEQHDVKRRRQTHQRPHALAGRLRRAAAVRRTEPPADASAAMRRRFFARFIFPRRGCRPLSRAPWRRAPPKSHRRRRQASGSSTMKPLKPRAGRRKNFCRLAPRRHRRRAARVRRPPRRRGDVAPPAAARRQKRQAERSAEGGGGIRAERSHMLSLACPRAPATKRRRVSLYPPHVADAGEA